MAQQLESVPLNYKCLKFDFTWTIDEFRPKIQINVDLFFAPEEHLRWQLDISPNVSREHESWMDLFLTLVRVGGYPIDTRVEFSILSSRGRNHVHKTMPFCFFYNSGMEKFSISQDILLFKKKLVIHNDRLWMRLVIHIQNIVTTPSHSDVTLTVGTQSFKAHKAVLAARCPVLHDLIEGAENTVTISDIEPEVFRQMLGFIYTGTVSGDVLNTMACDLFAASVDKYMLGQLEDICEEFLEQNLAVETAAETLITAALHKAPVLQDQAIDFIKNHAAAVMATDGWFKMASYPRILEEFVSQGKTEAGPNNSCEE